MRRTALLAMATLIACAFSTALFKVEPGPVAVGPQTVSGSFRLISAPDGDLEALMPDGKPGVTGGGCLVFQDALAQRTCTSQGAECDSQKPAAAGSAYCDYGATAAPKGTCWFRPTSDPCYRSKLDRLRVDEAHALTSNASPLPPPAKVRWRLMTCQGLAAGGCGKPDHVENLDYRLRWGPVSEPQ
ncbi:hypothetical protein AB4059_13515 [Lysobacter sp. 2RAF19]